MPTSTRIFAAALAEAAALAALSPSSHNCQPWGLAWLTGPGRDAAGALLGSDDGQQEYLALGLDRTRSLGSLPAHELEMRLSCGGYGQLLLRGLAAAGWTVDRTWLCPETDEGDRLGIGWPPGWTPLCVLALRGGSGSAEALADLRRTAGDRRTSRAPYGPGDVARVLAGALDEPGSGLSAGGGVTVTHLDSAADLGWFADLVTRWAGQDFSHLTAWRETHSFLRWSDAEAERRGDGLRTSEIFGPLPPWRELLTRLAVAPAGMRMLRHAGYPRHLARQMAVLVRNTPAVVVLGFETERPSGADTLRGGAALVDYWLQATRAGLALHPISVLVQHDGPRREIETRLGMPGRAFFVSRVGRPARPTPRSPRRPAASAVRLL